MHDRSSTTASPSAVAGGSPEPAARAREKGPEAVPQGAYHAFRVQVRWADCDPAGIVFYPRFFEWMDTSTHHLMRLLGVSARPPAGGSMRGFPLVRAAAEFLSPVRMDDVLEVRTRVPHIGRTSFGLRYEIVRLEEDGAETLVARGRETRVLVRHNARGQLRPLRLTAAMRAVLERYRTSAA